MPEPEHDAQELLNGVWLRPGEAIRLPVDPFEIARELGIRVYTMPMSTKIAGRLTQADAYSDPVIYLNENDSRNRQRFTCAHELGHYNQRISAGDAGGWTYVDHRDSLTSRGDDPDEVYANKFAAALLMPEDLVRKRADKYGRVVLAHQFGVSPDAMTYRLKNLGSRRSLKAIRRDKPMAGDGTAPLRAASESLVGSIPALSARPIRT